MSILYFINSNNNKTLQSFYEKLGIAWQKSKRDFLFYGVNNFFIILNTKDTESNFRKLLFVKNNKIMIKYNSNTVNYCNDLEILNIYREVKGQDILDSSKTIIPILCSSDIHHTANLYSF